MPHAWQRNIGTLVDPGEGGDSDVGSTIICRVRGTVEYALCHVENKGLRNPLSRTVSQLSAYVWPSLGYFSAPSGIFRRRFVEVTTLLTLGPWTLVLIPKPHNTGSTHATTRHTQHCSLGPRAAPWKYTCKPEITVGGEAGSRPRHCGGRTISPSSSNMEGFLKRMR